MSFKAIISGFETQEQAQRFLDWFEGQGEQDETLGEWIGDDVRYVSCDVKTGMIIHPDGAEYKVKLDR